MDLKSILDDNSALTSSTTVHEPLFPRPSQKSIHSFKHTLSQDLTGTKEELEWKLLSTISTRWHNSSGVSLARQSSIKGHREGTTFSQGSSFEAQSQSDSFGVSPVPQRNYIPLRNSFNPVVSANPPPVHTEYQYPQQDIASRETPIHTKSAPEVKYLFLSSPETPPDASLLAKLQMMDATTEASNQLALSATAAEKKALNVSEAVVELPGKATDATVLVGQPTGLNRSIDSPEPSCNVKAHTRLSDLLKAYTDALGDEIDSMEDRIQSLREIHYLTLSTIEDSTPDAIALSAPSFNQIFEAEVFEEAVVPHEPRVEPAPPDPQPLEPRMQIIHRVNCKGYCVPRRSISTSESMMLFFDEPQLYAGDNELRHIRGKNNVDLNSFIIEHPEVSVIVYKDYDCPGYCNKLQTDFRAEIRPNISTGAPFRLLHDGPKAVPQSESLSIVSDVLYDALLEIIARTKTISSTPMITKDFSSPYLFFYHYMDELRHGMLEFESHLVQLLEVLFHHIESTHAAEYAAAQAMIGRELVTPVHLSKLYRPGDLVLVGGLGEDRGYIIDQWPKAVLNAPETHSSFSISCWCWEFDGEFRVESTAFTASLRKDSQPQPIGSLSIVPERFYNPDSLHAIKNRGEKFWECRKQNYVTYNGWDYNKDQNHVDSRFMVDLQTYRKMHPDAAMFRNNTRRDDLGEAKMASDKPPDDIFPLLLSPTIFGFNMKDKTWVNLNVSQMSPIKWNKDAFDRLVLKREKKDLIKALVSIQIAGNKSTDYIGGKGNGLIVLLHGGPGTGKTLTAESVAELAEKPLYRVTCGDIGTSPELVERYLESILYIGNTWGCVVLLDEADVFLEERSLSDLQRNGLVSVFLRVLEYYDGIFILTSNRVGTFDEAFKSRIQLALHYPKLTETDRRKIWRNFTRMLKELEEDIDFDDLNDNNDDLAKREMNGREIRNAVTTARQLAEFKKEKLTYSHLELVISTASEFNRYLEGTRGHTDDEYAKQAQIRS